MFMISEDREAVSSEILVSMFHINVVEKIKTHILCSVTFFRISCRL